MYLGEIIEIADKNELFSNPLHPYTKALLAAAPKINTNQIAEKTYLDGDLPSVKNLPKGCYFASRCNRTKTLCQIKHPQLVEITPTHKVACLYTNQ